MKYPPRRINKIFSVEDKWRIHRISSRRINCLCKVVGDINASECKAKCKLIEHLSPFTIKVDWWSKLIDSVSTLILKMIELMFTNKAKLRCLWPCSMSNQKFNQNLILKWYQLSLTSNISAKTSSNLSCRGCFWILTTSRFQNYH